MTNKEPATTSTSRLIHADRQQAYAAFLDRDALLAWLPPAQMRAEIYSFDAHIGGGYSMSLFYPENEKNFRGKTSAKEDRVDVRFVELDPPYRIVESIRFVSDDPSFHGEMAMIANFDEVADGTNVTLRFTNLPPGLRPEDNDAGAQLSLKQLAKFLER
ncbi:SRPBCC domain-containing protein [Edaphobacter albus]|uniref:SRPBCC domain-containing protein n=1 Tax=Edaphobacter sp. 4G125 TaxID=2763071 RepID=UPI001647ACCC|nr:SRPBCC domain-containing protein [Edaphobacter sp. 4G125]QNI37333.1 SRPBCC domain-containing protein [Edaphobacter sp. 4G125]